MQKIILIKKTSYKKYLIFEWVFSIHRNLILPGSVRLKYESMAHISFYLMIIFRIAVPQHHEIQSRFFHVISQSFVLKSWTSSLNGLQHRYSMKSKARHNVCVFGLKSAKLTTSAPLVFHQMLLQRFSQKTTPGVIGGWKHGGAQGLEGGLRQLLESRAQGLQVGRVLWFWLRVWGVLEPEYMG